MSTFDEWLAANGGGSAQRGGGSFDAWLAANGVSGQKAPNVLDAKEYKAQVEKRALEDMPSVISSVGVGFGKGLVQSGNEFNRLVGHGLKLIGADGLGGDWLVNNAKQTDRILNDVAKPYKNANPTAAGIGEFGGNVAASFAPMGAANKVLPAYKAASTLGKVGIAAAQGAAGSILNPTQNAESSGDYWANKAKDAAIGAGAGAAISGIASYAAKGAQAAWDNAAGVVQPVIAPEKYVGHGIVGVLSELEAAKAAQNIRNAPKYVEGSTPTTAQAAGLPALVQTEKAASNLPTFRTESTNRQIANNQARWDALNRVAGNELDLKNAIANRETSVQTLYNTAKQQAFPIDENISGLMSTPFMQSAITRAEKLAANTRSGKIFSTTQEAGPFSYELGKPTAETTLTGNGAHHIKMALDDMLGEQAVNGIRGAENRALREVRDAYMTWLEGRSPEYSKARNLYKEMSPHVNGMQAAQDMAENLGGFGRSLNANGMPEITASGYSSALNKAKRGLDFGMHPSQEVALESIAKDLQRGTISNSIKTSGSDTAYNLAANGWLANKLYGSGFEGASPIARTVGGALSGLGLGGPIGAVGGGLSSMFGGQKIGQMVSEPLQKSLAHLLMNPEAMLPYLEAKASNGAMPQVANPAISNSMQKLIDMMRQSAPSGLLSLMGGQ